MPVLSVVTEGEKGEHSDRDGLGRAVSDRTSRWGNAGVPARRDGARERRGFRFRLDAELFRQFMFEPLILRERRVATPLALIELHDGTMDRLLQSIDAQ